MEVINEASDFDVLNYLDSPEDNWSALCEEFDFDLDMMLGNNESSTIQNGNNSSITNNVISCDTVPQLFSKQSNLHLFGRQDWKRRRNKNCRLVLPVCKITDNFKQELEMEPNILVVNINKDLTKKTKLKKKLKCENTSSTSTSSIESIEDGVCLEEFAHIQGSYLLPKLDDTIMTQPIVQKSSPNPVAATVPIHHASLNWNSFCLMKMLCKDGTENVIYQRGNILLPKVNLSYNKFEEAQSRKAYKKQRPATVKAIFSESNEMPQKIQEASKNMKKVWENSENIPQNKCLHFKNDTILGNGCATNTKQIKKSFLLYDKKTKDTENLKDGFQNTLDLSKYPNFKIKYLKSMKERLNRINSLPLPKEEFDLVANDSITDDEKIVLREFFENPELTMRYIQIRNHILGMWRKQKPRHLGKTQARRGFQKPCDVNILGLVYHYLERIGAINHSSLNIIM